MSRRNFVRFRFWVARFFGPRPFKMVKLPPIKLTSKCSPPLPPVKLTSKARPKPPPVKAPPSFCKKSRPPVPPLRNVWLAWHWEVVEHRASRCQQCCDSQDVEGWLRNLDLWLAASQRLHAAIEERLAALG